MRRDAAVKCGWFTTCLWLLAFIGSGRAKHALAGSRRRRSSTMPSLTLTTPSTLLTLRSRVDSSNLRYNATAVARLMHFGRINSAVRSK